MFTSIYTWKLNLILERSYNMDLQLDALNTKVDSLLAKLSANSSVLAAVQADADKARADLATLQQQVATDKAAEQAAIDALVAKMP